MPMMQALVLASLSALTSALLTYAALRYAHRRAMLDQPGRRRSHRVATARGGGVGMVVAASLLLLYLAADASVELPLAVAYLLGLLAVAAVGWRDDHHPLSASVRLVAHVFAAVCFVGTLAPSVVDVPWPWIPLWALAIVTVINFWNFMDGIDGLMGTQSAWVAGCLAVLHASAGETGWAMLCLGIAAAAFGFLPFNFPRARIFMGDVGSGALGFALAALAVHAHARGVADLWTLVLIASVPLLDAGLTLMSRMLRGRRWYTAHREHLYQWLVRSGLSHARTTLLYSCWVLIVVLPLLFLARGMPSYAPAWGLLGLTFGGSAWVVGKRMAMRRVRSPQRE